MSAFTFFTMLAITLGLTVLVLWLGIVDDEDN